MADLLGGKGANLAEMTVLGLPVPPGFIVTTQACTAYLRDGDLPSGLAEEVAQHLTALETAMGKRLGDADDPLLVSVRSGGRFSMPGHDGHGAERRAQRPQRAGPGRAVRQQPLRLGLLPPPAGDVRQDGARRRRRAVRARGRRGQAGQGHPDDLDLDADDLQALVARFKEVVARQTGDDFPQDPQAQLDLAMRAVFGSWNTERARLYRRQERIPADLGTAVNVCAMVFGNLGMDSGTGVAFTRDPGSGAPGLYGDYLQNAQGEDVVAGVRNTVGLDQLEQFDKASFDRLVEIMATLEQHYRDLCDIEFTIERGTLWMLQTRVGKRTAGAAFRIATQLVDEGVLQLDEALTRVTGAQLAQLMFPRFGSTTDATALTRGMGASPGAAVGTAVFTSEEAVRLATQGRSVILIRRETTPDDLAGMIAAQGILTSRGGKTSHAAVVARGMGKTCVCGADELEVDAEAGTATVGGTVVRTGDVLSIDGTSGQVFLGEVAVTPSPVVQYFEGQLDPTDGDDLVQSVHRLVSHADTVRRLGVRTNADTAEDSERARRFGAQGIGLCRTEHMFLGERRQLVEDLVLAEGEQAQHAALAALLPLQREDFVAILRAMDGMPVTVRLLDPPLHEFLPDFVELQVEVAVAEATGKQVDAKRAALLEHVRRLHESNPMIGLRGVRLGLVVPGLFGVQVRALAEAAAQLRAEGLDPRPEVMVPLVSAVQELEIVREEAEEIIAEVAARTGQDVPTLVGTMIEIPRAALTAGPIAASADFFSFGTNDLTQMGYGFSRDDVEGSFFGRYLELGVFGVSPFESIDVAGIGRLVQIAVDEGRAARPGLKIGVCGEHGGDPDSVHFFHRAGLDYVSCSPFRVPVARLEAGRAAVAATTSDTR